jgi:hypothetical protein
MSILTWLKGLKQRRLDDEDFEEEVRAHLKIAEDERMADGADRETAHYAALKDFGNVTLTTEAARQRVDPTVARGPARPVERRPLRDPGAREEPDLLAHRGGVLTLGIGLNAAVFTMLKSMALSPLAGVDDSARLSVMYGETGAGRDVAVSYPDYEYLRDHDRAFSGLLGLRVISANLGRGRSARPIFAEVVSGNYFQVLGVRAQRGRTLLPSDTDAAGSSRSSCSAMRCGGTDFRADPDIVGKSVEINNSMLTVVGVADPTFHGTTVSYDVEAFIPVTMAPQLGITFGSAQTTPSAILSNRLGGGLLHPRTPAAGDDPCAGGCGDRRALGDALARPAPHRCHRAPESRRLLAVPGQRSGAHAAHADRPECYGPAGAHDRVREHRGARAGARRVAAR